MKRMGGMGSTRLAKSRRTAAKGRTKGPGGGAGSRAGGRVSPKGGAPAAPGGGRPPSIPGLTLPPPADGPFGRT